MTKPRKKYTAEFKQEIIKLITEQGKTEKSLEPEKKLKRLLLNILKSSTIAIVSIHHWGINRQMSMKMNILKMLVTQPKLYAAKAY